MCGHLMREAVEFVWVIVEGKIEEINGEEDRE